MTASTGSGDLAAALARKSLVRRLVVAAALAALVVVYLVATGIGARNDSDTKLRDWTEAQSIPTVALVTLNREPGVISLNLPGRLDANVRAPIYARVSGYVKSRNADIGDAVTGGQLLAEIDAPDLDQQLLQARADLSSAEASARLSEVTLTRGRTLLTSNAVAQQDVDQRAADLDNKRAAVQADQANVERLQALADYKRVAAPFDGVVTERNTDVGALISAGSSAGAPMFVISELRKLRASINVPQNYVPQIPIGAKATVTVPEYPGRKFPAVVEASSRSVDVASGSTLMQLGIDNAGGALMPGAYASVHLDLAGAPGAFRIPVSALIFDRSGLRVATVGADNRVALKTVTIARDLGSEIEIGSGIGPDDRVIASPADGIADGDEVRIAEPRSKS
ncbi:MAG: efflux RND transporter periplasmic adaptor subunit [Bradyrhizobium sp.]|nr:MAG: efflux RND transporter periplasmic adaptor subunit [Bradyrhizobium sp.]